MSCDNLEIPAPIQTQCPTNIFGIPWGTNGRTVAGQAFTEAGIVIHCYAGTINQLCNELKCASKSSIVSGSTENSYHFGVGISGHVHQFVCPTDISWSFGAYKNNTYASVPPGNTPINWPTLQGIYGLNVTPDVYTINIALALGIQVDATGCYQCPTSSGLPEPQHEELVQLLAYLASEYNIAIDTEHIQFHDNIRCDDVQECPCLDIDQLLGEVAAFCPPCEGDVAPAAPEAEVDDNILYIMGITEACCPNSPGCYVKIPWNECFIGNLATDGTLDNYILGLSYNNATGQWCMTRGCLGVLNPLQGCGTVDDPLGINLCAWGAFVPDQAADDLVMVDGVDAQGCLIQVPATDLVGLHETPITVIDSTTVDLTASGVANHTLQADVKVSATAGNQIEVMADGLYVDFDCDDIANTFSTGGNVETLLGFDGAGACVQQDALGMISRELCLIPENANIMPTWVLVKDDTTCPVYTTPAMVVAAGFDTVDSTCIDITWENNQLSIEPIIDPAADNILTCGANGMYVPDLIPISTDCIAVNYVGRVLTLTPVISGPVGGVQNQVSCTETGFFVPRGADALVNGPLTGTGSDLDPLDIDFSLMNNQDLCDFGSVIPAGVLDDFVGRDTAGCLRREDGADVIARFLVADDTNCIDLTLTGNILTADPIISGIADNILTCEADGLYVGNVVLTGDATDCITVDITNNIVTATPIVSPTIAGVLNALTCTPTGLFVPVGAGIVPITTNCVEGTFDPTTGQLTFDLILNPNADNQLTCTPNGAYVPAAAGLIANDTDCIDLDLIGGELTANPILAGVQGGVPNVLSCIAGQGLYVPEGANLQVVDTTCIDLEYVNNVLQATIIVDPTGDNQLTCLPSGLYVPPLAGLQVANTPCIALSLNVDTLSATPILAPAQAGCDNALQCLPDGLFVETLTFTDTDCFAWTNAGCDWQLNAIIAPAQPDGLGGFIPNGVECIPGEGLYVANNIAGIDVFSIQDLFANVELIIGGNIVTFQGINGATAVVSATDTVTIDGHMMCAGGAPTAVPPYDTDQAWSYYDSTNSITYNWNCIAGQWETPAHITNATTYPNAATCSTDVAITGVAAGVWTPGVSIYHIPAGIGPGPATFPRTWQLATDCTWSQIGGDGVIDVSDQVGVTGLAEAVVNTVDLNVIASDDYNAVDLAADTITITQDGCYTVTLAGVVAYFGSNFDSALFRSSYRVNGINRKHVVDMSISELDRPIGGEFTIPFTGSYTDCFNEGDVIQVTSEMTTNVGGNTYDIKAIGIRLTSLNH